jgi:hypothetical protein
MGERVVIRRNSPVQNRLQLWQEMIACGGGCGDVGG